MLIILILSVLDLLIWQQTYLSLFQQTCLPTSCSVTNRCWQVSQKKLWSNSPPCLYFLYCFRFDASVNCCPHTPHVYKIRFRVSVELIKGDCISTRLELAETNSYLGINWPSCICRVCSILSSSFWMKIFVAAVTVDRDRRHSTVFFVTVLVFVVWDRRTRTVDFRTIQVILLLVWFVTVWLLFCHVSHLLLNSCLLSWIFFSSSKASFSLANSLFFSANKSFDSCIFRISRFTNTYFLSHNFQRSQLRYAFYPLSTDC